MPNARTSSPPPRLIDDNGPPTIIEHSTGRALVEQARQIATHAAQLCEQVDRFVRKEIEPIQTRLGLIEQTSQAHQRELAKLRDELRRALEELDTLRRSSHTGA